MGSSNRSEHYCFVQKISNDGRNNGPPNRLNKAIVSAHYLPAPSILSIFNSGMTCIHNRTHSNNRPRTLQQRRAGHSTGAAGQSQPAYGAIGIPAARCMPCEELREEKRQSQRHIMVSLVFASRAQG